MTTQTVYQSKNKPQERDCPSCASSRIWAVVVTLLVIQTGLLAYSGYVHSPTLNEPAHLAAGISHWQFGSFELYRVNPPLVRSIAAIPVMLAGAKTDWSRLRNDPTMRTEFMVGKDFIAANGERSFILVTLARWACIPFAWIGGVVCFLWARDLYGSLAGVLAVTLWCFSPNILAHASLITSDAAATSLCLLACYLFWRWLRKPTWRQATVAGAALGVALLTKTTLIVLAPALPLAWLLYRYLDPLKTPRPKWIRDSLMQFAFVTVAFFTLNLGFGFEGTFTRLGDYSFISHTLTGQNSYGMGNRFASSSLAAIPIPLPLHYVRGIDVQWRDFEECSRPSYLAGEFKDRGWWYFYLYAMGIKVPLGAWGLFALTVIGRFSVMRKTALSSHETDDVDSLRPTAWKDEAFLLFPATLILIAVSSQTGFSEHLRYVLPIFPFMIIWISQAASLCDHHALSKFPSAASPGFLPKRSWLVATTVGLICWFVGSSLYAYPHSLAYFNELAGGVRGGNAYLLSSNADWGQDLLYLKQWLDEHPEVDKLNLAFCGHYDTSKLGFKYTVPPPQDIKTGRVPKLEPGWYAISVSFIRGYPWFVFDGNGNSVRYEIDSLSYFQRFQPTVSVGGSIYIFHI